VAKQPHLAELGSRDVLVVANQTCLSDGECDALRAAVERGCGLILTERPGECDENFRQRVAMPLADLHGNPRVHYLAKCPGRTSQSTSKPMRATMPARTLGILNTVRKRAQELLAAELHGGEIKQPLTYIDVYRQPEHVVAHVVYYGDDRPEKRRLRVAPWLATGKPVLYSPYLDAPIELPRSPDGWIDLPEQFGRYAAVRMPRANS